MMAPKLTSVDGQQDELPGTELAYVTFEGVNTETAQEFKLGDTVQGSFTGVVSKVGDELMKDGRTRRVYKFRAQSSID